MYKTLQSMFRNWRYGNAANYRNKLRIDQFFEAASERASFREAWQHPMWTCSQQPMELPEPKARYTHEEETFRALSDSLYGVKPGLRKT